VDREAAGHPVRGAILFVHSAIDCDGVCTLTLNHPEALNSLSNNMLSALKAELIALKSNSAARVLILAGSGRAFCAGHNLKEMHSQRDDSAHAKQLFALCSEVMLLLSEMPQPVVARVHGVATAAGCQLVAACDLAVAAESARFATSGINLGLFCTTPGVALGRSVGRKHAMELLLTGEFIGAKKAAEIGLVNRVVPDSELEEETVSLAKSIAKKSSFSLALGKRAFYQQLGMPLVDAYAFACEEMARNFEHEDAAEGIGTFVEKRSNPLKKIPPPCFVNDKKKRSVGLAPFSG
jgi:enoyl-CoA hydratase/carnithine racemase